MAKTIPFKSKQRKKVKVKTPEQIRQEKHVSLLNTIISETYTRHNDLPSKEYKKLITNGKQTHLEEEQLIDVSMYNIMVEVAKVLLDTQAKLNFATKILRDIGIEKNLIELEKEGEINE